MISATEEYRSAIIGDSRRMRIRAAVHIVDPDLQYGTVTANSESVWSNSAQLHDEETKLGTPYITLEQGRWLLDGTFDYAEDLPESTEIGLETDTAFSDMGAGNQYCELTFSGVSVLQECSVNFPDNDYDGFPVELTIDIKSGDTVEYTKTITENTDRRIKLGGFTVNNPTAIRVTVTKWSLPNHYMRIAEIIVGVHEEWRDDVIAEFSVVHQCDVTSVTLPYGTAQITFDNTDKRFDPDNKQGLFASLEERQGIDLFLGVDTDGGTEFKKLGVFYQYADGWRTRGSITIQWSLVDLIGLIANRPYTVPSTLPTNLTGWVESILSQLGTEFTALHDITNGSTNVSASASALANQKCGQILLWLCQATAMWASVSAESGKLVIRPLTDIAGGGIDYANMLQYPTITANEDIARVEVTLSGGSVVTVQGNVNAAKVVSIRNPFISNSTQANALGSLILASSGGNRLEVSGRGDPTRELGDTMTIETSGGDVDGRLIYQDYKFQNGVLTSCLSKLIEVTE